MDRQPLLLLTADDILAERWYALGDKWQVERATTLSSLPKWAASGNRLVLADIGVSREPIWKSAEWRDAIDRLTVLAASPRPGDDEGLELLNAGASGYCHTHASPENLHQAVEVIASGELWVGRALLSRLLQRVGHHLTGRGQAAWSDTLTEREREVAQQAALGQSNLVIGLTLGITERTVKAHLKSVFEKLGVVDRLQLALRVHGIL
ncbi:MAG: response regulator transcription factor [Zoogloea sp.]|nr:response regulator transcription factor [Zoogloea sp.]